MESMDELVRVADFESEIYSTHVFRSNTERIGRLSAEEAEAVTDFYTGLLTVQNVTKEMPGLEKASLKTIETNMGGLIEEMEELRTTAISELERNLND